MFDIRLKYLQRFERLMFQVLFEEHVFANVADPYVIIELVEQFFYYHHEMHDFLPIHRVMSPFFGIR